MGYVDMTCSITCIHYGKQGLCVEDYIHSIKCAHCGIIRHTKDSCYKLHGHPPLKKGKDKTSQQWSTHDFALDEDSNDELMLTKGDQEQIMLILNKRRQSTSHVACSTTHVAGIFPTHCNFTCWIVALRASDYITNNFNCLISPYS